MSKPNLPQDEYHQLCEAKHGTFLYNVNDTSVGRSLAYYGEYSEAEIEMFAQFVRPGDVVIEAGSNIGSHTIPLARMVGSGGLVYAFEAQPALFQTLCTNLELNDIHHVRAFNCAVGADDGVIGVPDIPLGTPNNMGAYSLRHHHAGKETVPLVALDSFLKDKNHDRIAFIMADIEKMEPELLRGAEQTIRGSQPIVYMECHHGSPEGDEAIGLLRGWGYRVYRHYVYIHNPNNFAGKSEMLMDKNYAAHNIVAVPAHVALECTKPLQELGG